MREAELCDLQNTGKHVINATVPSTNGGSFWSFRESVKKLKETKREREVPHNPQSGDTLTVTYRAKDFTDGDGAVDNHKIQLLTFGGFLKTKGVLFTRLDPVAEGEGDGGLLLPAGTRLSSLAIERSNLPIFLFIISVDTVSFGI